MQTLNDLKQIWLSADVTNLPTPGEVVKTIKQYRFNQILKSVALLFFTLILLTVMCYVLIAYKSHFITTRIGEACFFIAMFILLAVNITSLKRVISKIDYTNEAFINFLKKEQQRQIAFQKRTQVIGFVLASIGLLLYIFEEVHTGTVKMIIAYAVAVAWLLFCWFIIRSISIKRRTKKLSETIKKFENISKQLLNN